MSVGDEEYARWNAGNIRGIGKRKRFVRREKDADGNEVNVYELVDDDEWAQPESSANYKHHLERHVLSSVFDPRCSYCVAAQGGLTHG